MYEQLGFADVFGIPYKIRKKIRLIELFAGYGSQYMALKEIGADVESWLVAEIDKYAIASYNAVHGTNYEVTDIKNLHGSDLKIVEKEKYCYICFYSFPCTDLSVAGNMAGMEEGSGTRSALLWEVKRLLDETEQLPQILIMENVPQIHSKKNMAQFQKWLDYLNSRGYSTVWQDLNAKNYGIPQSRNRTFVISILGDYTYKFPEQLTLGLQMKDFLEDEVEEKYYLKSDKAKELIDKLIKGGKILTDRQTVDLSVNSPEIINVANCIKARYDDGISNLRKDGCGVCEYVRIHRERDRKTSE